MKTKTMLAMAAFISAAVATHGASSAIIDAIDPPGSRTVLMEFGTKCMPNAYAEFEKRRDLARELGQVPDEEFPNPDSIGSDDSRRPTFEKVNGKFINAMREMVFQRNEICYHWVSYKFGVETDADLAKVDSSKLETGDRLWEKPKQHTFAKFEPMDGKFLEFAAKYAPECSAAYQKMAAEYGDSHKLLDETLAQKAALNYNWTDGVLFAALNKDGELVEKLNALSKSIQTWYYDHRTMEKTSEDVAKCDSTAALALKPFLDSLPTYLKNPENQLPIPMSQFVSIPGRDYKMCKYEVTQAQWEIVMGGNPSKFKGADRPVENVSWNAVQEFIGKLNAMPDVKKSGIVFRLPTADEWEHACRAGSTGEYGLLADGREGTLDEMGWYSGNSGNETHPVGQKKPNAWGLYDMHGNVWEWTSTAVVGSRVYCGGSWCNYGRAVACESGSRLRISPVNWDCDHGFRLALQGCEKGCAR